MYTNTLKYFVTFYEKGTVSRAAESLYITQQGLSRALGQLSQDLGVPLIEREGNHSVPTMYGHQFYQLAKSILEQHESLINSFSEIAQTTEGEIRLASALGVRPFLGVDLLADFEQRYPKIKITCTEYEDIDVEDQIVSGDLDIGMTIHPVDSKLFDSALLKSGIYYLICHRDNPLSRKKTIKFADLSDQPIIALTKKCKSTTMLIERCKEQGFYPQFVEHTQEMVVIWELIQSDRGVAVTSSGRALMKISNGCENFPLVAIPFDESERYHFSCYLIHKKGRPLSWPTQLLCQYILKQFDVE